MSRVNVIAAALMEFTAGLELPSTPERIAELARFINGHLSHREFAVDYAALNQLGRQERCTAMSLLLEFERILGTADGPS